MCFPVNFAKFLRIPFLENTSGRLLLYLKEIKCQEKRRKKDHCKEHLLKMQKNAEISATCLKGRESSQLFSSFFRDDM